MSVTSIESTPSSNAAFEPMGSKPLSEIQLEELTEVAKHLGLTEEEKCDFINAIKLNRVAGEAHIQGRLSWAAAAIRRGYKALPFLVRTTINHYIKIEALLNIIDAYTGKVEDAIKYGLKELGCPDSVAWWITKTLTAFVL